MTDEQVFKLIEGMNDEDAIGIMWGACIDWYLGDKQGACVSIKSLPKLIGLIVEWKNHKLAQAIATARAEGAAEERKKIVVSWDIADKSDEWAVLFWHKDENGKMILLTQLDKNSDDGGSFSLEALTTKEHCAE